MTPLDLLVTSPWWAQLSLIIVGAARLTMLLYADRITDPFRTWLWSTRDPSTSYVGYLFTCPWCVGVWVGSATTAAWMMWPRPTLAIATAAVVAGLAAYLCVLVDEE